MRGGARRRRPAYLSAKLSTDTRDTIARIYLAERARGVKRGDFVSVLHDAGFSVDTRTLNRWAAAVEARGDALTPVKVSGREKTLSPENVRLLVGFVLFKNSKNVPVHRRDAGEFVRSHLKLQITDQTVGTYLKASGFSKRVLKSKSSGYKLSDDELFLLYRNWILKQRQDGLFDRDLCLINSGDCTFTSHRTGRPTTWSLTGG